MQTKGTAIKFSTARALLLGIGMVFLSIVAVFCLSQARAINFTQHNQYVSDLRRLNELDARVNKDILQARYRMLQYYDPINRDFQELKRVQNRLQNIPKFIDRPSQEQIQRLIQDYRAIFQQKEELSEYFKTQNATLNNSLAYFPRAIDNLVDRASLPNSDREFAVRLNALLHHVLLYNLSPSRELRNTLQSQLERLRFERSRWAKTVKLSELDNAIAHAQIIWANLPQVNQFIEQILALPSNQRGDILAQAYDLHYQSALKTANIYRFWLYLLSLILLASGAAAIILKLQQSAVAIRQAEEKYHSIFENSINGIFQTTPSGIYLSANPSLARILGYKSPQELYEKLVDLNHQLYVLPERRAEFMRALEERETVSDFESQIYRPNGRKIWISENARTVRDRAGHLLYYEGTVEDITARKQAEEALHLEREKSERLLLNILPKAIAEQLKQATNSLSQDTDRAPIAEHFEQVTVLFADIVGFTSLSARMSAKELVNLLNQLFSRFDELAQQHDLEKIKTIGDAYMVAGGLPRPRVDCVEAIADMALEMQEIVRRFQAEKGEALQIRIGINTGQVIAGVIGRQKFIYDLWGDAVNIASRMESSGLPGKIQVTTHTYELLQDRYKFEERGIISVKGRGEMMTYWLRGRK
jgi:PAS domain S-box-containing protein